MPRILKSRDYRTEELLEIAEQLLSRTAEERHNCYTSAEREKNSIEAAYHRQVKRLLEKKLLDQKENTATQGGLF